MAQSKTAILKLAEDYYNQIKNKYHDKSAETKKAKKILSKRNKKNR